MDISRIQEIAGDAHTVAGCHRGSLSSDFEFLISFCSRVNAERMRSEFLGKEGFFSMLVFDMVSFSCACMK